MISFRLLCVRVCFIVLIFMLQVLEPMEWQNRSNSGNIANIRENGTPEECVVRMRNLVKMHDNKSNKNRFCACVCLNFHPISFSIHVIEACTLAHTHQASPFIIVCSCVHSSPLFLLLFVHLSLPKYNGTVTNAFIRYFVFCLHISAIGFLANPLCLCLKKSAYHNEAQTNTRSTYFDTKLNSNKTNSTHLDLYLDTSADIRAVVVFAVIVVDVPLRRIYLYYIFV